ncbi:hypothetical protein [Miltoncostaea oceani]|uniref:hypothetical protein n=1 Tax=Miltoncostaea oceani TaxID=2843216 RepID=UPI001C3CA586|nr:hypothetical protein [Miltoncostaea oceani]
MSHDPKALRARILADCPLALSDLPPGERDRTFEVLWAAITRPDPGLSRRPTAPSRAHESLPARAPRLIGLAGAPQAGKDVIAAHLSSRFSSVSHLAFSDPILGEVNAFLEPFGVEIHDQNKSTPEYRLTLQQWAMMRRRESETYWSAQASARVEGLWRDGARMVVATGVRDEFDVRAVLGLGGQMWRVERPGSDQDLSHPIERSLAGLPDSVFSATLVNDSEGDVSDFCRRAELLLERAAVVPSRV